MSMLDVLKIEPKLISNWEKIVDGDGFFQRLLRENKNSDWFSITEELERWERVIEVCRFEELTETEYEEKSNQLKHAHKLLVLAVACYQNEESVKQILENNRIELLSLFDNLSKSQAKQFDELGIKNDEFIVLSSIFSKRSLTSNVRKVPFVTGSEDTHGKGRVHFLELRKFESYHLAMRNPANFPNVSNYARNITTDFQQAIQNALDANLDNWENEKAQLKEQISQLESTDQHSNSFKLNALKKDLSYMEEMGNIERYGIIWDVKPLHPSPEFEYINNDDYLYEKDENTNVENITGESAGLAAFTGIYFTLRNKFPDSRILYSVKLETNMRLQDKNPSKIKFSRVGYIPSKIRAAIETDFIDTFVIHEDNFKGNERDEIAHLIKGKNLRIKTIDSNGNDLETYVNP